MIDALQRVEVAVRALRDVDDADAIQLPLRRIARRMAMLAIGARLAEQANQFAADTGSGRLGWIAARYLCRTGGEPALAAFADDASWLAHAEGCSTVATCLSRSQPTRLAAPRRRSLLQAR